MRLFVSVCLGLVSSIVVAAPPAWDQISTVHNGLITEWRSLTLKDKVASAGSLFGTYFKTGILSNEIHLDFETANSANDLVGYVIELASCIDLSVESALDESHGVRLSANEKVNMFSAVCAIELGWMKK